MEHLLDCPELPRQPRPSNLKIRDPKTKQTVKVTIPSGRRAFARLTDIPDAGGQSSQMAEAVLVSERGVGRAAVVVIELKGTIKPERADRPFEQVAATARHFCDDAEGHGALHHEQWRSGDDLPSRRDEQVDLSKGHALLGVIVTSRGGTRHRPRTSVVAGRTFTTVVLQRHGKHGIASIGLDEILAFLDTP